MTSELSVLDSLERRLGHLEAQLPAERTNDEHDAAAAMLACVRELRRLVDALPAARAAFAEAENAEDQQAARLALQHVIHDLRTPAGVLYTYLRLIVASVLFPEASPSQREEAAALIAMVHAIRDGAKMESSL